MKGTIASALDATTALDSHCEAFRYPLRACAHHFELTFNYGLARIFGRKVPQICATDTTEAAHNKLYFLIIKNNPLSLIETRQNSIFYCFQDRFFPILSNFSLFHIQAPLVS